MTVMTSGGGDDDGGGGRKSQMAVVYRYAGLYAGGEGADAFGDEDDAAFDEQRGEGGEDVVGGEEGHERAEVDVVEQRVGVVRPAEGVVLGLGLLRGAAGGRVLDRELQRAARLRQWLLVNRTQEHRARTERHS